MAADSSDPLRTRLAAAIVVLSILSALAVWRASVHEEFASQSDVHFRQQLVLLEQVDRTLQDTISEELSLFGAFEEHRVRSAGLSAEASRTATDDPALARRFQQQARAEQRVGEMELGGFQQQGLEFTGRGVRYDAAGAYRDAVTYDTERAAFRPAEHRHEATSEREDGVTLALVAALFLAGLVFMTLAEVALAPRQKGMPSPRRAAARFLAGSGVAVALAAAGLFATVGW